MPGFRFPRRFKALIRRWNGDPPVMLEEYPDCPNLFRHYREMISTGHKRVPGGWKWQDVFYPDHLTVGGACFGAFGSAKKWCHGEGIDIGAGGWPFPGAKPIDPSWYPDGLKLEDVPLHSQDYVFTSHTLEHIKDWRGAIVVFAKKIRPGGIIFIYLPHSECGLWRMDNPFMTKHHEWIPEPAVVKEAVKDLGMEIVDFDDGPDAMMSFFVCARIPRQV